MPDDDSAEWRCLYVHRYVDQDGFLVDGLTPVILALGESGVPHRFFFLRYWQGGHHIRVRLRLPSAVADDVLAEVTGKLAGYLAEHPDQTGLDADGFAVAQPTMASLEDERVEPVQPPDTIRAAVYRPEYDKYGGPIGVAIAEDFFAASSAIALSTLANAPGGSGRRLGSALSMMLRGLCAAGLTAADMAAFFAHYCRYWAPYVFDSFLDTWPELLARRGPAVAAHAGQLLAERAALTDPFTVAVATAYERVAAHADEVLPLVTIAGPDAPADRRRQVLLVSYLHTHNNRLGLIPEQEAFLGYLGHHVLATTAGIPAHAELPEAVRAVRAARLAQ